MENSSSFKNFEAEFNKLSFDADILQFSMIKELEGDEAVEKQLSRFNNITADEIRKKIGNFNSLYEAWYSTCCSALKRLMPDRLDDFTKLYKDKSLRKGIGYQNYTISDYLIGLKVTLSGEIIASRKAAWPKLIAQINIFNSLKHYLNSKFSNIEATIQFEIFEKELESAKSLFKLGFLRASGAICGVILERHLAEVAKSKSLKLLKKHPTINDFNELLKNNDIIDQSQWRFITFLGDIRNICAHEKGIEPNIEQVTDLLSGTDKIIRTIN